jgi:outer membrane protein
MKLQQFQKELSERERDMTRGIYEKMVAITHEIAAAEGFTMVFERNDAGLIVAPPSLDLTDEMVRKFNARYKPGSEGSRPKRSGGDKKKDAGKAGAPAKAP